MFFEAAAIIDPMLVPDAAHDDAQIARAVDDLTADWERQGWLGRDQIDRLVSKRKLDPGQVATVIARLKDSSVEITEEPGADDLEESVQKTNAPGEEYDSVSLLLKEAQQHQLLSHADEVRLGRAVLVASRVGFDGSHVETKNPEELAEILRRGKSAREQMILSNIKLVFYIAKRYQFFSSLSMSDLVQEGMFGLMKAVDRFDPDRGYRFATYAMWWIRQTIMRAIANRGATIRMPVHRHRDLAILRKTVASLRQENEGQEPTLLEIAAALDWAPDKVAYLQELSTLSVISLDSRVDDEIGSDLASILPSNTLSPEEEFIVRERVDLIRELVERLPPKERDIVQRRFGMTENGDRETLEEIGRDYEVTRERIRQIERDALLGMVRQAKKWNLRGNKE